MSEFYIRAEELRDWVGEWSRYLEMVIFAMFSEGLIKKPPFFFFDFHISGLLLSILS